MSGMPYVGSGGTVPWHEFLEGIDKNRQDAPSERAHFRNYAEPAEVSTGADAEAIRQKRIAGSPN